MNDAEFERFAAQHLESSSSELQQLAQGHHRWRAANLGCLALFIMLAGLVIVRLAGGMPSWPPWVLPWWGWLLFVATWIGIGIGEMLVDFKGKLMASVLPPLLQHYGDLAYRPDGNKDIDLPFDALLPGHNRRQVGAGFQGTICGGALDLVQVVCSEEYSTGDDEETTRHIWQGIVARLSIDRRLSGSYVLKARAGTEGWAGTFDGLPGCERIRLESAEFEKGFQFYGTDQIEGRTLFDPEAIERCLALLGDQDRVPGLKLVWHEAQLFLALRTPSAALLGAAIKGKDVRAIARDMARELSWLFEVLAFGATARPTRTAAA